MSGPGTPITHRVTFRTTGSNASSMVPEIIGNSAKPANSVQIRFTMIAAMSPHPKAVAGNNSWDTQSTGPSPGMVNNGTSGTNEIDR